MSRVSRTRMSLLQWFREMDCHIRQSQILLTSHLTWISSALLAVAQFAIDSCFKVNNDTCHLLSLNIHLFMVAEHSVRPTATQPSFTAALCWSCAWSIARFETYESSYWLWSVPSEILLTCRDAKETESSYLGGELIPIAHIGNGHKLKTSVQASSMTGYMAGSCQTG